MKIIAYILNFNKDDNARRISHSLSCENYVIDSSGIAKSGFIATDEPLYGGCLNKAIQHFLRTEATHMFIVCSDVIGDVNSVIQKSEQLHSNIGIYAPSIEGQGWEQNKPQGMNTRHVLFAEGIIGCYHRDIIETSLPVVRGNLYGWGTDLYMGYVCELLGMDCIVDDSLVIYHPYGSAYSQRLARRQMKRFIHSVGGEFAVFCDTVGVFDTYAQRLLRKLTATDLGKIFGCYR